MQARQVFPAYQNADARHREQYTYCPLCGTRLVLAERGGRRRPACPSCRFVQFGNPSPGVVILIEEDGQVLLGKRAGGFGAGKWGLPQGFLEFDEDFLGSAIGGQQRRRPL